MTNPPKIMHNHANRAHNLMVFSLTCATVMSSIGLFNSLKNLSKFALYAGDEFFVEQRGEEKPGNRDHNHTETP